MRPSVVIIGGGPAGLAAAIVLGRQQVPTVLIERGAFPIDKPCGEGLLPNAVRSLERLGIRTSSLEAVGRPLTGVRYVAPSGRTAEARFPRGTGMGVRRTELSRLLVDEALRWPSVTIISRTRAELTVTDAGYAVTIGRDRLTPSLIIAADGLTSRTRDAAGIATHIDRDRRWGMRQQVAVAPWHDGVEVHFGRGFEAYVTPLSHGVNVAILWDPRSVTPPAGDSAVLALAARLPRLGPRLVGAMTLSPVAAAGPFRREPTRRAADGLVLIGDAAGYVDALTGEGVGLALAQAEALDRHVVPRLVAAADGRVLQARDLDPFVNEVERASRPNRDLTRLMLQIGRRPWLVEHVVGWLASSPRVFAHALEVNMGGRELWPRIRPRPSRASENHAPRD